MNTQIILSVIVLAIIILAFIIYVAWEIHKRGLKQFAIDSIVKAEDMYKKGDNQKKLDYVIDKVITVLPAPLSFFLTREIIKEFVQSVFDSVKKALDYVPRKEN